MVFVKFLFLCASLASVYCQDLGNTEWGSTIKMFDCRRPGQDCGAQRECQTGANSHLCATACKTPASYTAVSPYTCVETSTISPCTGDAAYFCQNGGTCRVLGGAPKCWCDEKYWGNQCQHPRVKIDCETDDTKIKITIKPLDDGTTHFNGKIYPEGKLDTAACHLTKTGTDPDAKWEKEWTIPAAAASPDSCGITHTDATANAAAFTTVNMIIQYHETFISTPDQKLSLKCSRPASGTVKTSVNEIGSSIAALDTGSVDTQTFKGVKFQITSDTTTPDPTVVTATQSIGAQLYIHVKLDDTSAQQLFKAIRVTNCAATNGYLTSGANRVKLTEANGCPAVDKSVVGYEPHVINVDAAPTQLFIPFKAFKFIQGNKLFITCDINLYDDTNKNTAKIDPGATCGSSTIVAAGRRKRSAAGTATTTMSQVVTVTSGNTTVTLKNNAGENGAQNAMTKASECLDNPQMQTVLAVLGLLLVLAVVALTATAVMYCRARNTQDSQAKFVDNYGYPMGSSTQTLAMPKI